MPQIMLPVNWRHWDIQMCGITPRESLTGLLPVYQPKARIIIERCFLVTTELVPDTRFILTTDQVGNHEIRFGVERAHLILRTRAL